MLEGELVKLRAVEPTDIEALLRWENDPSNWFVGGTVTPYSKHVLVQYIANAKQSIYEAGQYRFMIVRKMDGKAIGTVDLFEFDAFHRRAGVGILIGEESDRGQGYAKETLDLLKNYCFNFLDCNQLYCHIAVDNKPSIKLFSQAGFKVTGTMPQWLRVGDTYIDQLLLQLLKTDVDAH